MGIYKAINGEFEFLIKAYGFEIYDKQRRGSYYFISYKNQNIRISVFYILPEESQVLVCIYDDGDGAGTIVDPILKYKETFDLINESPRDRLHRAAEWLKNIIEDLLSNRFSIET